MTTHFLRAYSQLLIKTCHRRGAFAMGGMAAQIPIKNDPAANEAALAKVRADKEREVERRPRRHLGRASRPGADRAGGVRRAHADAEPDRTCSATTCTSRAADLLQVPTGTITEAGLRDNIERRPAVSRSLAAAATAACRSTT